MATSEVSTYVDKPIAEAWEVFIDEPKLPE